MRTIHSKSQTDRRSIISRRSTTNRRRASVYLGHDGAPKTDEQILFFTILHKKCTLKNRQLLILWFICFWVCFVTYFQSEEFVFVYKIRHRCLVPTLENKLDYEKILNLTNPSHQNINGKYCSMVDTPEEDLTLAQPSNQYKKCQDHKVEIVSKYDFTNIKETEKNVNPTMHRLVCDQEHKKVLLEIFDKIGLFLFVVPLGYISDRYGRKKAFIITLSISLLGYFCLAVSETLGAHYFGRFCSGANFLSLIYISIILMEGSDFKIRTKMVLVFLSLGKLFAAGFDLILVMCSASWKIRAYLKLALYLSLLPLLYFLRESLRWIFLNSNSSNAWKILNEETPAPSMPSTSTQRQEHSKVTLKGHFKVIQKAHFRTGIALHALLLGAKIAYKDQKTVTEVILLNTHSLRIIVAIIFIALVAFMAVLLHFASRRNTLITLLSLSIFFNLIIFVDASDIVSLVQFCYIGGIVLHDLIKMMQMIMLIEKFPTTHRCTAISLIVASYCLFDIILFFYHTYNESKNAVIHMPVFISNCCALLLANYLPESKHLELPDLPRESVPIYIY